jgi:hypothetical protein
MSEGLSTYLQDHIAGAEAAIEVIDLLNRHSNEPVLTQLLSALFLEVQEDKVTLERITNSLTIKASVLKNTSARLGARLVSLKANTGASPFGAFEGLEFLSLGIQGKLHLWAALQLSPACAAAAYRPDYAVLMDRAGRQHRKVEDLRLALARIALEFYAFSLA